MDARNHTLNLFSQYEKAMESGGFTAPRLPNVNPPLWELGHVGWFQEWWIARNTQRALGTRCESIRTRLASIEPSADRWWNAQAVPHSARWTLDLPGAAHCRAYLLDTLESTLELLEKTTPAGQGAVGDDALYFYRLSLFFEDMRGEALVRSAQALGLALDKTLEDAFTPAPMAPVSYTHLTLPTKRIV